jgi:transcriptional regulator with XRE-family HTH domain
MGKRKFERCSKIDSAIGRRIRTLRDVRRVTQAQIGEVLGVSFQQIQRYEQGVNTLGPTQLVRLASYFGIPVGRFFDGMGIDEEGGVTTLTKTQNDLNARVLDVALQMNAVPNTVARDKFLDLVSVLAGVLSGDRSFAPRR